MSDSDPKPPGFTVQDPPSDEGFPRIDFSTFALSLATSAMVHLGQAPPPDGESPPEPNLPLAQHTIDTLEMLQEKTRGNLSDEEAKLLQSVLYELRMGFVRAKG